MFNSDFLTVREDEFLTCAGIVLGEILKRRCRTQEYDTSRLYGDREGFNAIAGRVERGLRNGSVPASVSAVDRKRPWLSKRPNRTVDCQRERRRIEGSLF